MLRVTYIDGKVDTYEADLVAPQSVGSPMLLLIKAHNDGREAGISDIVAFVPERMVKKIEVVQPGADENGVH